MLGYSQKILLLRKNCSTPVSESEKEVQFMLGDYFVVICFSTVLFKSPYLMKIISVCSVLGSVSNLLMLHCKCQLLIKDW